MRTNTNYTGEKPQSETVWSHIVRVLVVCVLIVRVLILLILSVRVLIMCVLTACVTCVRVRVQFSSCVFSVFVSAIHPDVKKDRP